LDQPEGINTPKHKLETWQDKKALIRGNKLYWHRQSPSTPGEHSWSEYKVAYSKSNFERLCNDNNIKLTDFQENLKPSGSTFNVFTKGLTPRLKKIILDSIESSKKYETQHTKIKPLKPNNTFTGRIRFENLTNEELGALLFAIELPENCCHKLGMGKPYGLGTVKLSIEKLHIDDRQERYNKLIKDDGNWNLPDKKISAEKLKKDFSDYMLEKLGEKSKSSLWDVDRMKELKTMLEYDEKEMAEDAWLKETAYMDLQEFRKRNVLPKPSEVLALAKKKK